jgi:hypothetical protein
LLPSAESLVAPDWIPWSERLADYKALQAELEAQAFLDAAEADEDSEDDSDEDEDLEDEINGEDLIEDSEEHIEEVLFDIANEDAADEKSIEVLGDSAEELAAANLDESETAEGDSENTGRKPPRFFGRRKRGIKGAARNKGKNPKD